VESDGARLACADAMAIVSQPPKLLDQVRQAIRLRHYSPRTEESYVGWIRAFILFSRQATPS
jgi:hypothetical protein